MKPCCHQPGRLWFVALLTATPPCMQPMTKLIVMQYSRITADLELSVTYMDTKGFSDTISIPADLELCETYMDIGLHAGGALLPLASQQPLRGILPWLYTFFIGIFLVPTDIELSKTNIVEYACVIRAQNGAEV